MPSEPISFGILLYPIQAIDVIGFVDVITNLTPKEVAMYGHNVPDHDIQTLVDSSLDITFHWVSHSMNPVTCTEGALLKPTCTYDDCPKFDYLLVGGPHTYVALGDSIEVVRLREFLRQQQNQVKKIFTTCTGALTVATSGILDGHQATVNHACVEFAKTKFPNVKWVSDKNWVEGEKFWTSSGAVAGMDMAGEWVRQMSGGPDLLYLTTVMLDWRPRDVHGNTMDHYNGNKKFIQGPC